MSDAFFAQRLPMCSVCQQPVALETAKTDEDGHAIHEDCYFARFRRDAAPVPGSPMQGPSTG